MTIALAFAVGIWFGLLLAYMTVHYSDYRFNKRCRDNSRNPSDLCTYCGSLLIGTKHHGRLCRFCGKPEGVPASIHSYHPGTKEDQ